MRYSIHWFAGECDLRDAAASRTEYALLASRSLQASYTLLQAIIQRTTDAIFLKNMEGRYMLVNPAGGRIFGTAVEDAIRKNDIKLLDSEIGHKIKEADNQVISSGQTQVYEEVLLIGKQERTSVSTKDVYRNP